MTEIDNAHRVHQVMAGFSVWLSAQGVPACRPASVRQATARFQRWRLNEAQAGFGEPSFDEWRHYSWLRQEGAREDELATAREALALLRRYVREDFVMAIAPGPPSVPPATK